MNKAKAVIVPSLWEDPGFVMVEAAFNLTPLIVSDCPSGPKEFIDKDKNIIVKKKIKNALDKSLNYTDINHYRLLKKFI